MDFDGTICLGDGPIWAYADGVLAHLPADQANGITAALRAYLDGDPAAGDHVDGYSALAALAGPHVAAPVLDDAYTRSRRALEDARIDIHAPDGLADLLDELAGRVRRVVVTNAPDTGLDVALERLGLAERIDEVVASAAKPEGAPAVLTRLLAGAAPRELMSVGDIWRNDIAPALDAGCATAFVDRSGRDDRPAHVRARTIQPLYPAIREWANAPAEFAASHLIDLPAVPSDS